MAGGSFGGVTAGKRVDPATWGVQTEYVDASGARRRVSREAARAVLESLGAAQSPPPLPPLVARRELLPHRGSVARCFLPDQLRGWGWALQLYALRSRDSWGIGDLGDLRAFARWAKRMGAAFVMINPLHASRPGTPQQASPYSPSSRLYRNLLHLNIDDLPGARASSAVQELRVRAQRLNTSEVIDRDSVYRLKLHALETLFDGFDGHRGFDEYCRREGALLEQFACFCVLAEKHTGSWREWPTDARTPAVALRKLSRSDRRRLDFHRWVQWHLERQLRRAASELPIVHDLAVGFTADGADAWIWQDLVAFGVRIGAPPDAFSPSGQDWGLVPFNPHKLRDAACAPWVETMRRSMTGGGVRIDHVMAMFRLWWIPPEASDGSAGAYVRYPANMLLNALGDVSEQTSTYVVGEDLGTVEDGVRPELRRRKVLSYRLAWFEQAAPRRFPVQSLGALTTHDLATVAGLWTGADARELHASGQAVNPEASSGLRRKLERLAGVAEDAKPDRVIERAYAALAEAPSRLVAATVEDACAGQRRPNLPGVTARPNWCIPLPRTLEQLRRDELPARIATRMARHR